MKHRKVNALLAFLILAGAGSVRADGSDQAASGWAGTYAGLFAGFGKPITGLWTWKVLQTGAIPATA